MKLRLQNVRTYYQFSVPNLTVDSSLDEGMLDIPRHMPLSISFLVCHPSS